MNLDRALDHCAEEVRRHDYDRYLCALFAAPQARRRLFALYAFNLELSRIAGSVNEPGLGEIRLEWWRETLDGVADDNPREHPVALALAASGAMHTWPRHRLDQLIDVRAHDLADMPFADRDALTGYAEQTASAMLHLSLDVVCEEDAVTRNAATPLGRAWALTGILRATPYLVGQGRCLIPADVLARHNLTRRSLGQKAARDKVRNAVAEVAKWALAELETGAGGRTPRAALPVTLTATLARAYLKRLHRVQYDPFDAGLALSPLSRQIAVYWAAVRNRP